MPRNYVIQTPKLAVALGRMKVDVNFIGIIDRKTAGWLIDNHVFLSDIWEDGEITIHRIQRLYHRLFPNDQILFDMSLDNTLLLKAVTYAKELNACVILCVQTGEVVDASICGFIDILINKGGIILGKPRLKIELGINEK